MKKIDKLKRTRFELSMKIIELEDKKSKKGLSTKEESELKIIKAKEQSLDLKIQEISN